MKRVDWDPNGERHPEMRGKSGYERISWDEAIDIIASEIKRVQETYGEASLSGMTSSHHNWGVVGYKMGPFHRFMHMLHFTPVYDNPDSWEGWHWGATHTYGFQWRLGMPEQFDLLEDALQNTDMIVFWNEELDIPQIYTLDAHRLDEGEKLPRCVESCPTQALHWGDLNDPESDASKFIAEHPGEIEDLFPKEGADYVVRYYKLPKPFIAGELLREDLPDECVEGAKITCTCAECGKVLETKTNFLGDFEFKYLKPGRTYQITAEYPGYATKTVEITLDEAKDLGTIILEKA